MDSPDRAFRSILDYFGFLAYATIVGGGLPPQELLDAAHPRSLRLARAARGGSRLMVVARNDTPAAAVVDERFSSAA